jgi:hypothetical protein
MTKYNLKYNIFIPLLRLTLIALLIWTLIQIIKGIVANGVHLDLSALGLLIFISVPTFIIYRITKRLIAESNYIILDKDKIIIYNLIKFQKLYFKTTECVFLNSYRTPFDTLILKLPNGKYIHILSYDYFDFKKLDKLFVDNGINKEGFINDITT